MCSMNPITAQEIYEFVNRLSTEMRREGRTALAERLEKVKKFYTRPLTSEFLGEAMLALKSILAEVDCCLDPELRESAASYATGIQTQYFSPPSRSHNT